LSDEPYFIYCRQFQAVVKPVIGSAECCFPPGNDRVRQFEIHPRYILKILGYIRNIPGYILKIPGYMRNLPWNILKIIGNGRNITGNILKIVVSRLRGNDRVRQFEIHP
jgi:hypothetical protein